MTRTARVVWWLLVSLVALSVIDAWTTWQAVGSGEAKERNPVSRMFIDHLGLGGAAIVRVLSACVLVSVLAMWVQRRPGRTTLTIVGIFAGLGVAWWAVVCVNNLSWLAKT